MARNLHLYAFERGITDRIEGRTKNPLIYTRQRLRDEYARGYDSVKLFDVLHERGPKEFGVLWLKAQQAATRAAVMTENDPSREPLRTTLSLVVWHLLQLVRSETDGESGEPTRVQTEGDRLPKV